MVTFPVRVDPETNPHVCGKFVIQPDHLLHGALCAVCETEFQVGQWIALVFIGRELKGSRTASSVPVHGQCVKGQ